MSFAYRGQVMTESFDNDWKKLLPQPHVAVAWLGLIAVIGWMYSSVIVGLVSTWWNEPDYIHGFLVPIFAVILLWLRREMADPLPSSGTLWALPVFAFWLLVYASGLFFNYEWLRPFSLLPLLVAATMFIGGWRGLKWAWPSLVFLFFMIPLPRAAAGMLSEPLQLVGTQCSVYLIQTLGIPAAVQGGAGNVINLMHGQLGVVEACSGLRMLMLFFTVCVGAAFVVPVTSWEKALLVVSAVPIAVFANVARITLTAILYEMAHRWPSVISTETADHIFHDLAGWLMMPLAIVLLWGEMTLISKLLLAPVSERPVMLPGSLSGRSSVEDALVPAGRPRPTGKVR